MIDPQLEKIGWSLRDQTKVGIEIPVDGYDAEPWNGVSDYTLLRENGDILAIVETEKIITNVDLAEQESLRRHLSALRASAYPAYLCGAGANVN